MPEIVELKEARSTPPRLKLGEIQTEPTVQQPSTPTASTNNNKDANLTGNELGRVGNDSNNSAPAANFTASRATPETIGAGGALQTMVATSNCARLANKRSQVVVSNISSGSSSSTQSSCQLTSCSSASGWSSTNSRQTTVDASPFHGRAAQMCLGPAGGGGGAGSPAQVLTAGGAGAPNPVATALQTTAAIGDPASTARALQTQNSSASLISAANVRQLTKSFDSLKNLSMDELRNTLPKQQDDECSLPSLTLPASAQNGAVAISGDSGSKVKVFEQKQSYSSSSKKISTGEFSTEEATEDSEQLTRLRQGSTSLQQHSASSDLRARLQMNGVKAEKALSTRQEERQLRSGRLCHEESRSAAVAGAKLSTDNFQRQQTAMEQTQQRRTRDATGSVNQQQRSHKTALSTVTVNQQGEVTQNRQTTSFAFEELDRLERSTNPMDVGQAVINCSSYMSQLLRDASDESKTKHIPLFDEMDVLLRKAWSVPTHGHELGNSLCDVIRDNGGLDMLIKTCNTGSKEADLRSASVLEQCLTTENRQYVVDTGLDDVVRSACRTCSEKADERESRVGSGILEHLFKHSEVTCSDVVRMGGLDAVITQCRNKDLETLRHCASALANLSLYGGPENQQAMIKRKVPTWLFPLAFHNDDNIKYYACLAISSMVANKEIEAAVLKSGTLELVEPFVTSHDPDQFSKSTVAHFHGQSRNWLKRLVPVLLSDREEARKLAAFHFCMEAGIKLRQGCPEIFEEIGAIEPLKQVASSPNAVASKYAAQALQLLGHEVPHKLSQQVPLWNVADVKEWVKQIHFAQYADSFVRSRMDGDLLLRLTEDMLKNDIGMENGILRNRFMRELNNLKKMADYSSCDSTGLNAFLQSIGPDFSVYTYKMLSCGVDRDCLRYLSDEQLHIECDVFNSIHRLRIHEAIKNESAPAEIAEHMDKTLDCFISYRRSNGSQLASLLKVHLELRGFSVFIDVERLEAGKFDNNLLNSIRQAHNFVLVLTPSALDRCIQDYDQKDWVHKEVHAALQAKCNIIPIIDNFQWPEPEELPDDIKSVCTFNGVRWIHDYQEACVDKLERFMRGESNRGEPRYITGGVRGHSPMGAIGPARATSPCLSRGQSPGRWTPGGGGRSPLPPMSPRRLLQYQRRASPVMSRDRRRQLARSRSLDAILDSDVAAAALADGGPLLSRSQDQLDSYDAGQQSEPTPLVEEPHSPGGEPHLPAGYTPSADGDREPSFSCASAAEREPSVATEVSRDSDVSHEGRKQKDGLMGRTLNKVRNMITKENKT